MVMRMGTKTNENNIVGQGASTREDGWAPLGPVGSQMTKNQPSFDPRNYGFPKLGELMRKQSYLEVKEVPMDNGSTNVHLHVRLT